MSEEQAERDRRLQGLEEKLRRLSADFAELQREVSQLRGGPSVVPLPLRKAVVSAAPAPAPVEGTDAPRAQTPLPPRATVSGGVVSGGVEQAIGRYGTLVVATLAILLGLGAFLQWAVARGLLGPEIRVALGAMAAAVLAALGLWLRRKGNRTFGNALLAIALAVVHLVAWGAGPVLGIVPPMIALGVAAAASVGLASLAVREGEELLFALGLGGALLAPFVTMRGEGGPAQLLVFGAVVLSASIFALRDASWRIAPRLLSPLALWYMVAAAPMRQPEHGIGAVYWPTAFAFVLALVALSVGARATRRGMVTGMLFLVAVGIVIAGGHRDELRWTGIVYALLGTLTLHALRRRAAAEPANAAAPAAATDAAPDRWVEVVGMPLLFMGIALVANDAWRFAEGPWISIAWIALTVPFLLTDAATQRANHLAVMLTAAIALPSSLFQGNEAAIVSSFAAVAALSTYAFVRIPGKALFLPIGLTLGFGTLRAFVLINDRVRWEYTPFVNEPALIGALMVGAWLFLSYSVRKTRELVVLGPIVAFFWIRGELAEAYSRDIATFLLITYYSLAGVGTLLLGRKRESDGLRQAGLALSLFAAGKAGVSANDLSNIGLRVGSFLIVGVFILGVGYLYRAVPAEEQSTG